jgi:Zn-dependent peptidase ImmA (M78 family)
VDPDDRQSSEWTGGAPRVPEVVPAGLPPLNQAPPPEDAAYAEKYARELPPLLEHWSARAAEIEESFLSPEKRTPLQRKALRRFANLCLRFADLEQRIEGAIVCEIPAHFGVIRGDDEPLCPEQGERLAQAERKRLGLPEGPIENLSEMLDERGIKILEWDSGTDEDSGAFLFEQDTGPALLALAPVGSHAGRFLLAHAYGHLLADVDPYENRFCRHGSPLQNGGMRSGGRAADSPVPDYATESRERIEARADRFARALLLPADHFRESLGMFGQGGPYGFDLQRLGELGFYYGVETGVVLQRLSDLHLAPDERVALLASELAHGRRSADRQRPLSEGAEASAATDATGAEEPGIVGQLPARFVNLCLALFVKRIASRAQLGRLLNLDPVTVDRMIGWLDLPPAFRERKA